MVCFWYIALDLPRYFVKRFLRVRATSDGGACVTILGLFYCTGFFSPSLDTEKTWYHCFEFQPMSWKAIHVRVTPIQSRFLARNLSSLTRWRSCLCELVLRAADGAGVLVRCFSISFATSPSAKSCF